MNHAPTTRRRALLQTLRCTASVGLGGLGWDALAQGATAASATTLAGRLPPYNKAAFEAKSLADVLKAWGAAPAQESKDIALDAPELSENGASVPVSVSTSLPGVKRLLLLVPKNPFALAAAFTLGEGSEARLALRIKMNQTADVLAVALLADGRTLVARREVKITIGGCGVGVESTVAARPPEPSKIRAHAGSPATSVRVLLAHEMESGQRKDAAGKTVPAWHIQQVSVLHNGKLAAALECGPSVAKNPLLQLSLQNAKPGDKIAVRWQDNRGESRTDEALV